MAKKAKRPAAKQRDKTERHYNDILYEVKDQVAWLTINRPRVLNAFREQTLDELIDALKSTREDPSIACAVVTGAGDKSFSAGGDFYAMKRLNWVNGAMWNDRMQGLAMTIRGQPLLGVQARGVRACRGVGPTQYRPRIIGERLAREMIFCARRFTADE